MPSHRFSFFEVIGSGTRHPAGRFLLTLLLAGPVLQPAAAQTPFDDPDPPPKAPATNPNEPKKPNLVELMKGAPLMTEWEKQWQAAPGDEPNALAAAGLRVAAALTRKDQVAQAKDPAVGGSREDLLLTMDVARHEFLKHALKTAIQRANEELGKMGQKRIEKVMVSNCSPLGDGTRDGDLTLEAEDDVREATLFRHLADFFDQHQNPNLATKLLPQEKGKGRAFSVDGLEISFHRGQNDVPPPHIPMDRANFAIKYRRNIERQFENPEAYLGFGAEQEVQGRRGLRLAGKKPAQVLVQTFTVGKDGAAGYAANRYTNQKAALDALRTTLGPDYTSAHNAMHVFCDFIQASHHQHETDQDISKGPIKYAERALNAICRLHGFDEWKKLPEKSRAQVLQLALGPGFNNPEQLGNLAQKLNHVFGQSGQKVGDSAESAVAMSLLRRASARALQEVARVMMDPPPIRPANLPLERWNSLNRQEQEQLARTDPEYLKRVSIAAMENLVIATRLLSQIDMEAGKSGPATPFGTMALRRVIEESQGNPRLQKVLQLATDHAEVDAAIERNCPPGMDLKAWQNQRRALVEKRSKLRYELAQECAAYRDSPDRAAVETAMKGNPRDVLKKSKTNLIPPELATLQAKRAEQARLAMGGEDPLPPMQRAAQFGKNAMGLALSHAADPNNLPDMLSLVEMYQDGAGAKDYSRFMVRTAAGRFNSVVGYAVGVTEISMIQDAAEQEKQLAEMGKGLVFDILSRYIPGLAQAKLAFDIEKGLVNVTYGYAIKSLNASLVDALYLGEAGRVGPGRAGTLSGWVRDAVDPVLPEAYVVHYQDETSGKEQVGIDAVRIYADKFREWTGRAHDEIGRITDLKPKSLALVRAHDRIVNLLQSRAEGMEPGWFADNTVGLYTESDLDAAIRELLGLLDPLVRPMVNGALESVPQVRTYKEKRGDQTVDAIEEGLVGRLSGDFISGLQSEWNTTFMKQRQLKRNLDGLMSTAVTHSLAEELAQPALRIVKGQGLPAFEIEIHARTPDRSLLWELNGNLPLPLVCQLKAKGEMPDDVPNVQISLQTADLVPVPASYRPYRNTPAGNCPVAEAQKDPSLWANGVFRQTLIVQAVVVGIGQVIAEQKAELIVRFTPQASLRLAPAAAQALTDEPVVFTVTGSALPARPRFTWDMGNGSIQSTYEPKLSYAYPKEGSFKVAVKLFDGSKVYVGGQKAPVLAEAAATTTIAKDTRLKHYIEYYDAEKKQPSWEYWYNEDRSGPRLVHLREGEEKKWFSNGKLSTLITYQKNVPNGRVEAYYENGKPKIIGTLKDGKGDGHMVEYHENGVKSSEGNLTQDEKVGAWTNWDEWGRVMGTGSYNARHKAEGVHKSWGSLYAPSGEKPEIYLSSVIEYADGEAVHTILYSHTGKIDREWRK